MKTRTMTIFVALMFVALPAIAQTDDGDKIVSVPKRYVSSEGLNHQATAVDTASRWVGIGREIGQATREGLDAVVNTAEKFGSTKVGTFVLFMIFWKIAAKDVLGIVLGIPLLLGGIAIWIWLIKRFFIGYRVLAKQDGKVKTYEDHLPYKFSSSDARTGAGWAIGGLGFVFLMSMILFVIF